jgi:hypothetical protein
VFNDINSACNDLGTGAYHVGVEISGAEYATGNYRGAVGYVYLHTRSSPGTNIEQRLISGVNVSQLVGDLSKQIEGHRPRLLLYTHVEEYVWRANRSLKCNESTTDMIFAGVALPATHAFGQRIQPDEDFPRFR